MNSDQSDQSTNAPNEKINSTNQQTNKLTKKWGPNKGVGILSLFIFTPFLPRTKRECAEWKAMGESGDKFWFSPRSTGTVSSSHKQ